MENEEVQKQREKRKRVNRMKKMIVTTIIVYMLVSIIVMIFLVYKVFSLQHQISALSGNEGESTTVTAEYNTSSDDETVPILYTNDNSDNMLEEGEIPLVYLTFDDGPSDNTDAILDILDDYNVKATFFVIGDDSPEAAAKYKRIVDDGHTIGMHSYSHKYSDIYSSQEAFEADLSKIQNLIYDTTGVECKYYRFPGGSSNQVSNIDMSSFIQYLNEKGIVYYDWNVTSGDATSQAFTPDELVENVMSDVVKYKTSVVLMHDGSNKDNTVEALPKLIESLQAAGALIKPITDETTVIQHVSVLDK